MNFICKNQLLSLSLSLSLFLNLDFSEFKWYIRGMFFLTWDQDSPAKKYFKSQELNSFN